MGMGKRRVVGLIGGLVALYGCKGEPVVAPIPAPSTACADSIVLGDWDTTSGLPDLSFAATCALTAPDCEYTAEFDDAKESSGTLHVRVSATNGHVGCLRTGNTNCTYSVTGQPQVLRLDCGDGERTFSKKP